MKISKEKLKSRLIESIIAGLFMVLMMWVCSLILRDEFGWRDVAWYFISIAIGWFFLLGPFNEWYKKRYECQKCEKEKRTT